MIRRLRSFLWGRVVEVLAGRLGRGILQKMVVWGPYGSDAAAPLMDPAEVAVPPLIVAAELACVYSYIL